ncbi:PilW family protein [Alkalilimnicola sp. S0819]|uniref:PilW family protein n=1 Tax=Alkalilimnicola sp. S0819 TaxID=2613922 RepID=UPI0012615D8B|nr:PilW family protein [Alkalilimnicola sp. S0819]KAB7623154.1 hypothetical protein F3N43_10165 [Alkalilimnicola sp. S0819]MPQ16998.1 hypothetical protein [Alkalilimnicola sp. S0819]
MKQLYSVSRRQQYGVGLIEIMIALAISLLLVAGVVQIFISSKQGYRVQEAAGRLQEDGRFSMELVSRDVRMADFWGCLTDSGLITNRSGNAIFSTGLVGQVNGASDQFTAVKALGAGTALPAGAPVSGAITVPANHGHTTGDVVLIADCQRGDIVTLTGSDSTSISHATTLSKSYGPTARVYPLEAVTYAVTNGTLVRNGQPLIPNVEGFQVRYGVDVLPAGSPDGSADYYVDANTVTGNGTWEQVTSMRINVLLRSEEQNLTSGAQGYYFNGAAASNGDGRLRRGFSTTVTIRNRTG